VAAAIEFPRLTPYEAPDLRFAWRVRATVLQLPAAARPEAREKQATPEVREPSLSS
jgi:hypothetical protein